MVIYVRDFLERYEADALRYFIAVAGPETPGHRLHLGGVRPAQQRRARRRLGQPGQPDRLDGRTRTSAQIPAAGELTADDQALLGHGRGGLRARSASCIERHRQKAAIGEAMRVVGEANKYLSDQAPWKLKDRRERERLGTILHVAAAGGQRLQHAADAVPAALGASRSTSCSAAPGVSRRCREIEEVDDLDGGPGYPVITGDYTAAPRWESAPDRGRARRSAKPTPVFTKLDPSVVDEELARLGDRRSRRERRSGPRLERRGG